MRPLILLLAISYGLASAADPTVFHLDWEPACGGSSIRVTTSGGKLLLIEAFAEHHAESREWVCAFSDGMLVTATYRHYKISRSPEGDAGEFSVKMTLDRAAVFLVRDGELETMGAALKKDLHSMLAAAKAK